MISASNKSVRGPPIHSSFKDLQTEFPVKFTAFKPQDGSDDLNPRGH
jgi:hypothetical protein